MIKIEKRGSQDNKFTLLNNGLKYWNKNQDKMHPTYYLHTRVILIENNEDDILTKNVVYNNRKYLTKVKMRIDCEPGFYNIITINAKQIVMERAEEIQYPDFKTSILNVEYPNLISRMEIEKESYLLDISQILFKIATIGELCVNFDILQNLFKGIKTIQVAITKSNLKNHCIKMKYYEDFETYIMPIKIKEDM